MKKESDKKLFYGERLVCLLTVVFMLAAVALQKNGTICGKNAQDIFSSSTADAVASDTIQVLADGILLVNTAPIASEVYGYAGATPLHIYVKQGVIEKIEAQSNSETPDFFATATAKIFPQYIGKSVSEAQTITADAATGATYSSIALKENLRRGIAFVQPYATTQIAAAQTDEPLQQPFQTKNIIAILVILSGAILPYWLKGKGFRWIQLALNVIVLGCWCGTFVSYSLLIGYLSNGLRLWGAIVAVLLLVVAFLFPLFGKTRHYCLWLCPLGSAQEIIFRLVPRKVTISPLLSYWLSRLRWTIWSVLMLLMWTGVWFEWMDYELFSIFILQQAGWIVIALSIAFAVLSAFVSRPYCRFLCPTGCLLQTIENKKLDATM